MENWERIFAVFEQAIARPVEERQDWLDRVCAEDGSLRRGVEELLEAHEGGTSFLDKPLVRRQQGELSLQLAPGPHRPPEPQALGPYRILRRIGQGGMGTVYLAARSDESFQRRVAIKLVRPGMESEASLRRLRVEQQILASLDHPYIARLYDGGTSEEGLPYFVLEYVEGVPIDVYCDQNRLPVDERLTLFRKICSAVHYAHQNLVVHRDIKPSNTLIRSDGEPKLLDFGLAKLLNPELSFPELEPTATWQRLLTPNYASPEQFRGEQITTASDIYSLGILLYKLLTGRLPHDLSGRPVSEVERILAETVPLAPSIAVMEPRDEDRAVADEGPEMSRPELRKRLAGDLDAIVLKALRSAPRQRYGSVERFANDIERYQIGLPVTARAGTWRYRGGKFLRRHRKAAAAAVAVVVLLIGFAGAMAFQASRVAYERDQAREERDKKAQVLSLILELFRLSDPYVAPGEEMSVREALERSVPVLENGLHQQPSVRAELLHTSGSILSVLGVYDAAQRQLEEALRLRRQLYGETHPDFALTLSSLAAVHKEKGELDEAETLARQSVGIAHRLVDDQNEGSSLLLSAPLNELVSVLCFRNEYAAAEEPALEALALARELPETSSRITALEHLARIRSSQGVYRESVALNREALALHRTHYGEGHPEQIATLNNLGVGLRNMEEYAAARSAYQEALSLHRANFGDDQEDPYLLNNLASVHASLGELEQAKQLFREARDVVASRFDERHWMVLAFGLQVARMEIRQGSLAQAEGELRDLLAVWTAELGESWLLDLGTGLLGESLSLQERCAEARPLLVASFEGLRSHSKERTRKEALARLSDHLERCGEPESIARYEAML